MSTEKRLSIHTKKNWLMAIYMLLIGVLFLCISINLFDYTEGNWVANSIFVILFIFGILACITFLLFIFSKEKVLVFTMTNKNLTMSEAAHNDDEDYNTSVPLEDITNFYQKKSVRWGGLSTVINGLFYVDKNQRELLFLDLTMEVLIPQASVDKIVQFVMSKNKA